jgi:hypothetical protein
MKLESFGKGWFQHSCDKRIKRPPLISFREFADSVNISLEALRVYAGQSVEPFPKPKLRHGSTASTLSNSWYDKKELKNWWANRVAKRTLETLTRK